MNWIESELIAIILIPFDMINKAKREEEEEGFEYDSVQWNDHAEQRMLPTQDGHFQTQN